MSEFQVTVKPSEGLPEAVEAVVIGRITTIKEVAMFQSAITNSMVGRPCFLLLDFKDVPTIASSGLSFVADLVGRLEPKGGGVVLIHVNSSVKVVLNSLGLVQFIQFEESMDDARAFATSQVESTRRTPRLFVKNGTHQGSVYPCSATILIGSDPQATISVTAPQIERKHAEVSRSGDVVTVKDLNSRVGTWVGKKKVTQETLKSGDVITIAQLEILFLGSGDAVPA
jgi:anti-anti-sigma factor